MSCSAEVKYQILINSQFQINFLVLTCNADHNNLLFIIILFISSKFLVANTFLCSELTGAGVPTYKLFISKIKNTVKSVLHRILID